MNLFQYVIVRDYGFAPNPFFGICTLATCKQIIRRVAQIGDWVIATGSQTQGKAGLLVSAMKISEAMTFNEYWVDSRFQVKKPSKQGSLKHLYGDNIYHKENNQWLQSDSHHSNEDGVVNLKNLNRDTSVDRVLISKEFFYFGGNPVAIPVGLRGKVCRNKINHMRIDDPVVIAEFEHWIYSLENIGLGTPALFDRFERYRG